MIIIIFFIFFYFSSSFLLLVLCYLLLLLGAAAFAQATRPTLPQTYERLGFLRAIKILASD